MDNRPFRPLCASKIGRSIAARLADISSMTRHASSPSVAAACSAASALIRPVQYASSFFTTSTAMTGLHVAPTAPWSIAYASSASAAESFHRHVLVVCVIWCSGLLYETPGSMVDSTRPDRGLRFDIRRDRRHHLPRGDDRVGRRILLGIELN